MQKPAYHNYFLTFDKNLSKNLIKRCIIQSIQASQAFCRDKIHLSNRINQILIILLSKQELSDHIKAELNSFLPAYLEAAQDDVSKT